MIYNVSFTDNATLTTLFVGVNDASNSLFMLIFLLSIWIVLLLVFYDKTSFSGLIIGSGFIMAVLCGLMLAAGLIAGWVAFIPVLVVVIGLLVNFMG